jgi:hypothetical protein
MTVVITPNQLAARDNRAPSPAVKMDGSQFEWRMFYDSNRLVADCETTEDALGVLITGYAALSAEDKLQARINLAQTVQLKARTMIASRITPETAEKLKDWEWDVLTSAGDSYGWGLGEGTLGTIENDEVIDFWFSDLPLVLVTTSYAPHTEIPRPISKEGDYEEVKNLIWLRPEYELDFLRSLSRIGYIAFGTAQNVVN